MADNSEKTTSETQTAPSPPSSGTNDHQKDVSAEPSEQSVAEVSDLIKSSKTVDLSSPAAAGAGPKPEVREMPPIAQAGYTLASRVVWILAAAAGILVLFMAWNEFGVYRTHWQTVFKGLDGISGKPPALDKPDQVANYEKTIAATKLLIETVGARQKEAREFCMQVAQLILLSLFLPILTALLGYIFGTRQGDEGARSKKS
jgi:hypothetical protein